MSDPHTNPENAPPACLPPSRLWRLALQRDRWTADECRHVGHCPRCRRRLARTLQQAAPARDEAAAAAGTPLGSSPEDPALEPAPAAPPAAAGPGPAAGRGWSAAVRQVADLFAGGASVAVVL